jgi:hypothetical protein
MAILEEEEEYLLDSYTSGFSTNCKLITENALASAMGREPQPLKEAFEARMPRNGQMLMNMKLVSLKKIKHRTSSMSVMERYSRKPRDLGLWRKQCT